MVKKTVIGNPYHVATANPARHTGGLNTPSGSNLADKVCNIYDLEGSFYEIVAEQYNDSQPYVHRGGSYHMTEPAAYMRHLMYDNLGNNSWGSRAVLYITR